MRSHAMSEYNEFSRRTLILFQIVFGEQHKITICSKYGFIVSNNTYGVYPCLQSMKDILKVASKALGDNHEVTLEIAEGLAKAFINKEMLDSVEELFEILLNIRTALDGHDHGPTSTVDLLHAQGKYQAALEICNTIYPLMVERLGTKHRKPLMIQFKMAVSLSLQHNFLEAKKQIELVMPPLLKMLRHEDGTTIAVKSLYAKCLSELGEDERAREVYGHIMSALYRSKRSNDGSYFRVVD